MSGRGDARAGGGRLRVEVPEARETPAAVGTPDPTFGTAGLATFKLGGASVASDAVADPAGRVVIVGFTLGTGRGDYLVERVNTDGTLDATFGTGGKTTSRRSSGRRPPAGSVTEAAASTCPSRCSPRFPTGPVRGTPP